MMKLLLISDVHYGKNINYPHVGASDYVNTFGSEFPRIFSKLKSKIDEFDLLVNLGDGIAVEDQDKDFDRYKNFIGHFAGLEIPVKHVLGNHDTAFLSRAQLTQLNMQENTYFSFDLGGFHHVVLDGRLDDRLFSIGNNQLSWLRVDIGKSRFPVIVYSHYHCDEQSMENNVYFCRMPEKAFVKERKELRKIFEESGKVKLVFCGHTHFFHKEKINSIYYVTVPSFTENDGFGKPSGEYIEVFLNKFIKRIKLKKLFVD